MKQISQKVNVSHILTQNVSYYQHCNPSYLGPLDVYHVELCLMLLKRQMAKLTTSISVDVNVRRFKGISLTQ